MEAQEYIEELKAMGLMHLTIGYYTVYNKDEVSLNIIHIVWCSQKFITVTCKDG